MKNKLNADKVFKYIKITLIVLLAVIAVLACLQAAGAYMENDLPLRVVIIGALSLCCATLIVLASVSMFSVKGFAVKMVFFGFECALLLVICLLTGNSLLSALYCILLSECYITVERFRDKVILFGVSSATYAISFIAGWVINNPNASLFNGFMEIFTGTLFGLLILLIDFVIVHFLSSYYKMNKELRQALKEADESNAELKQANEQLALTRVYEERNRIAKDIHDNAGHSMTAVIMQTEVAKLLIDTDPQEAKNRIISANIQAKDALEQMRESVHLLVGKNPPMPLKAEVEEIIIRTFDGTGVKARYDVDEFTPDGDVRRFILNSLKECLANGIRHGGATAFYIELKENADCAELLVSDNGKGCAAVQEGFGLKGIREKAEMLGGSARFSGAEDEGFEVKITVPVNREKQND